MNARFAYPVRLLLALAVVACSTADESATGEVESSGGEATQILRADGMTATDLSLTDSLFDSTATGGSAAGGPARDGSGASASGGAVGGSATVGAGQPQRPSAVAAPATPPVGTRANDILERAEQAYAGVRSMEADFTQAVYVPLLDSTQQSRGKIFHRSPDRFLMRFSEPAGDIVVADGRFVWMYYPSTDPQQVMRGPLAEGGQQVDLQREFLNDAAQRYDATRTGGEMIAGRQTDALTLVPRGPSPYSRIRIWVDTRDHLVRRFEISEQNGTVRDLTLSNLRPNVPLADALFEFTPPPGTQVFEP